FLMAHPDEGIGRDRLLQTVWGFDAIVTTRAVDHRIAGIRGALGDDAARPVYRETVPGLGCRFVHPVVRACAVTSPAGSPPGAPRAPRHQRGRAGPDTGQPVAQPAARPCGPVPRVDPGLAAPIQGSRVPLATEPSERQRPGIDAQSDRLPGLLPSLR